MELFLLVGWGSVHEDNDQGRIKTIKQNKSSKHMIHLLWSRWCQSTISDSR